MLWAFSKDTPVQFEFRHNVSDKIYIEHLKIATFTSFLTFTRFVFTRFYKIHFLQDSFLNSAFRLRKGMTVFFHKPSFGTASKMCISSGVCGKIKARYSLQWSFRSAEPDNHLVYELITLLQDKCIGWKPVGNDLISCFH